jgi:sensor histidine kinase YesM
MKRGNHVKIRFRTLILWVCVLSSVLMLTALTVVFNEDMTNYVWSSSTQIYTLQTRTLGQRIEYSLARIRNIAELMRMDEALRKAALLSASTRDEFIKYQAHMDLEGLLREYIFSQDDILGISVVTGRGSVSAGKAGFHMLTLADLQTYLKEDLSALEDGVTLLRTQADTSYVILNQIRQGTLVYAAPVFDHEGLSAVYLVMVNPELLRNLLSDRSDCAVEMNGMVLFGREDLAALAGGASGTDAVSVLTHDGDEKERVFARRVKTDDIVILLEEDLGAVYAGVRVMRIWLVLALFFSALCALALCSRLFRHVLSPLSVLQAQVSAYESKPASPSDGAAPARSRLSLQARLNFLLVVTVLVPMLVYLGVYSFTAYQCAKSTVDGAYKNSFQTSGDILALALQEQYDILSTIGSSQIQSGETKAPLEERVLRVSQIWNTDLDLIALDESQSVLYATDAVSGSLFRFPDQPMPMGISVGDLVSDLPSGNNLPMFYRIVGPGRGASSPQSVQYMVSLIREGAIRAAYEETEATEAQILVCDAHGNIVSATEKSLIGTVADAGVLRDARGVYPIDGLKLKMYFFYRDSDLNEGVRSIVFGRVYLVITMFLALLIAFGWLGRVLARPLERIRMLLDKNTMIELAELYRNDSIIQEIDALGNSFNEMKLRIDELMDDLIRTRLHGYQAEIDRRDAELHSLQSQIHPHFLCNLLETIRLVNAAGNHEEANGMIRNIADLFRYSLSREQPIVTLAEELAYTRAYANILMRKYKNLQFVWNVEERAEGANVLRLLMQPLIENAALHGIAPGGKGGTVTVTCLLTDDGLYIAVHDDGRGMDLETVRFGVGLSNVQKRVGLYYQDSGRMEVCSAPGCGTTVRLLLPFKTAGGDQTAKAPQ